MKIVGIIAEYNPFHAGHAYQIARAKELSGADCCVVVMSGYFVQRGEPAVYDPFKRAKDALNAGADAVFAMPALFSCASAEYFADYGVGLLNDLGCDAISFGVESWDGEYLEEAARIISEEPEIYRNVLKERLKKGESFAAARMEAVRACMPAEGKATEDREDTMDVKGTGELKHPETPNRTQIIDQPNRILALEYLRALKSRGSSMEVVPIKRIGHGYHDEELPTYDDKPPVDGPTVGGGYTEVEAGDTEYPSATALRKRLKENGVGGCIFPEDIWPMMLSVTMRKIKDDEDFTRYADVSPEIAHRISSLMGKPCCGSFEAFTGELKTRQYAYTRINRCLTHIFLDHGKDDIAQAKNAGKYAFLLGFRKDAGGLLSQLKARSRVPIISKAADAGQMIEKFYDDGAAQIIRKVFESDVYASRLYATAYMCKYGKPMPDLYTSRVQISSQV